MNSNSDHTSSTTRQSLDRCQRKRIYLLRHGDVSYLQKDGTPVPDSRTVPLTEAGWANARLTAEALQEVHFDRAICSGLRRTVETASAMMDSRPDLELEHYPDLEEIQGIRRRTEQEKFNLIHAAYAFWDCQKPDSDYSHGESYSHAAQRTQSTIVKLLAEDGWSTMLAVCHGGVNRLLLSWAIGAPITSMACFEQEPCCINIIDVDLDTDRNIKRCILRGTNISARDLSHHKNQWTTMERLALSLLPESRSP
ncbi:MAG: histidine phosphatase family protein [Gammaproteobacteria bacterium]